MAQANDLHRYLNNNCFTFKKSNLIFPLLVWLGLANPSMARDKVYSRFPFISSFSHTSKQEFLLTHVQENDHRNGISSPVNPAFQLHHQKGFRVKREADDDDLDKDYSFNSNNAGYSGVQGTIGLNEMEITLIVVCSAIGLLMFIMGLIFLARYYWKKFHGDSHRYHGVMQRNSSESSMGTTRADPKEAMTRFEESEVANPYLLHPSDALLIKQQIIEQSAEKEPLLVPCANGTAFTDQIDSDNSDIKNDPKEMTPRTSSKPALPRNYVAQLQNTLNCRTGLSQSDCSISSFTTKNPSYKYGNQTGYMSGFYGYPHDTTFDNNVAKPSSVTAAIALPVVTFRCESVEEKKVSNEKADEEEQGGNDVNESDSIVEDDILSAEPYRLTGTTRALSLPDSFDREDDTSDESRNVDTVRPTDSGWGDTVKGQFRGSLPVLHLSVSPERENMAVRLGASSCPDGTDMTTDKSLPISLSNMLPKHSDKS